MSTITAAGTSTRGAGVTSAQPPVRRARVSVLPTAALVAGALYCLLPVAWVLVASTKSTAELFNSFLHFKLLQRFCFPASGLRHSFGHRFGPASPGDMN